MDNKDYPKVRKAALKQDWRVESVAQGEMFFSPEGSTTVTWHRQHRSSSPYALDRFVRELRRSGFKYPGGHGG